MRDKNGRFLLGVSSKHTGRPDEVGNVCELARKYTEEALGTLVDLARHAKSDAARGAAVQALLDRGYGKSVAVALDVVDDGQAHLEALRGHGVRGGRGHASTQRRQPFQAGGCPGARTRTMLPGRFSIRSLMLT